MGSGGRRCNKADCIHCRKLDPQVELPANINLHLFRTSDKEWRVRITASGISHTTDPVLTPALALLEAGVWLMECPVIPEEDRGVGTP